MINRYTADRKIRSDDAYTPGGEAGRPDRATLVYAQRCQKRSGRAGGAGRHRGSLRRIAHYDYWQDKVRRSILVDAKADLLVYGNAERAIVEGRTGWRGASPSRPSPTCAAPRSRATGAARGFMEIDSTEVDQPGRHRRAHPPPTR